MIDLIFTDLKSYLYNEVSEGVMAQWFIGMHQVFRGWVAKNWQNPLEIQPKKMIEVNKIIVRNSVRFYSAAWKQRNDTLHSPENYKMFVTNWYENIIDLINRENRPEMKRYLRQQEIDVQRCDVSYIRHWILGALKMRKITREEKVNDIRRYFVFE